MKRSFILMWVAALLVMLLDQATKFWISSSMTVGQDIPVIAGFARLRYTQNRGAAFGIFADATGILSIVSLLIIVGILVAFVRLGHPGRLSVLAAGLVVGGALGNLVDRVRLGYVVDFVEVYGPQVKINNTVYTFPVFNAADSAITVGVILILASLVFSKEPSPSTADNAAAPGEIDTPTPAGPDTEAKNASLARQ
jgi:signal peptidase II